MEIQKMILGVRTFLERMVAYFIDKKPLKKHISQDYLLKIAQELKRYKSVENVHDLPVIYHYWSNKYLLPKIQRLGIDTLQDFFCGYMIRTCNHSKNAICHFISIGAGNCDFEANIAETLLKQGINNFLLECLDINQHMLDRGKLLAQKKEVLGNLKFTNGDINFWQTEQKYHIVLVQHSLHHFVELELIFEKIYYILHPNGYFLVNDMIGRNGHMRWPEALMILNEIWKKLPDKYKYNHQLKRIEVEYDNWDCSKESFEGIRAQDILPLLIKSNFYFDMFLAFANLIDIFVDRSFGHNFDPNNEWDTSFIDNVAQLDEHYIETGLLKPTHIIAALTKFPINEMKIYKHLSPDFCARWPDADQQELLKIDEIKHRISSLITI